MWVAVGSIEGGGLVNLGAHSLIVVGPVATTFSSVTSGTAPEVFPSLTVPNPTYAGDHLGVRALVIDKWPAFSRGAALS